MPDLRPRRILHVDLAAEAPQELTPADVPVLLVVWWRDLPLGYQHVHRATTAAELAAGISTLVAPSVGQRLLGDDFPPPRPDGARLLTLRMVRGLVDPLRRLDDARPPLDGADGVSTTLAICTRDRPSELERCLRSVREAAAAPDELLVVDNAPDRPGTRQVVARFAACRYVPAPRPGLSAARNAAMAAARGDLVAFVDDDVVVHPQWLAPLRRAFAADDVMAVTGLVLPAELATEAQVAFETVQGGFALGCERRTYGRDFLRATGAHGMPVWKIGAGANMAIRRSAVELVGGFDERLGAGAAGCSEDSEYWYRLIAQGWSCRYEPASVVFHHHRQERAALAAQIHDYTRGHVAALFVQFARSRHAGNLRRALVALPRHFARRTVRAVAREAAVRAGLLSPRPVSTFRAELTGYLHGLGYARLAVPARPRHKAALWPFLERNPFPRPYTLGFFYREKMRAIHRIAPDVAVVDVLEVGGGRSGLARLLYPEARITTLDLEAEYGAADVNRDPRVRFVVGDATQLPFAEGSFDVVTFFDVLEHIPNDARAATEAMRVLRPGGFILVTTPSHRWRFPYYRALAPICPTDAEMVAEWGHVRCGYSPPELAQLFGRPPLMVAGFISPATALGHDLAWSKLPEPARRVLCALVSPLTWLAYAAQPASRPGTEIAASWRMPER
jgi:GT2 family glycosyltransferase/SAM-dependent methyltransferase